MIKTIVARLRRFSPRSDLVGLAQKELLLRHTRFQTLTAPFVALFLVLAFCAPDKLVLAWGWLAILVLSYAVRVAMISFSTRDPHRRFRINLFGLAGSGVLWALAPHTIAMNASEGQLIVGIFVGIVVLVGVVGNFLHYHSALVYFGTWIVPGLVSFGLVYVAAFPETGWTYIGVVLMFLLYAWKCLEVINLPLGESLELNQALTVEKERAQESDRAKSDFLAMMSHELRTPLNAIMGYSEIIRDQLFGPKAEKKYQEQAGHIREAAGLLTDLISDLLELSALQAKGRLLHIETVGAADLATTVMQLVGEGATRKRIHLQADVPADLPVLSVDRRASIQCLTNILANAIKYSPVGSEISITARVSAEFVEFCICDTGPGISVSDLRTVTEPFRRGSNAHEFSAQGVGLGLSIADGLMKDQNGFLAIESEPGHGTSVTLGFPIGAATAATVAPPDGEITITDH